MLERILLRAEATCYCPVEGEDFLKSPDQAYFMMRELCNEDEEPSCWAMALTERNRIIGILRIPNQHREGLPVGGKSFAKLALLSNAQKLMVFHNHFSGDPKPSDWDNYLTTCLNQSLESVNVDLMDHMVLGSQRYYSYLLDGKLKKE